MSLAINTFYSFRVLQWALYLHKTYANLSMGYHEIKLYDLIELNYNLDIRQYFVENWKKFLDDCEILLKTDLIKWDDLLTILDFVDNDIQLSMELNDNKLPFLDFLTFLITQIPV